MKIYDKVPNTPWSDSMYEGLRAKLRRNKKYVWSAYDGREFFYNGMETLPGTPVFPLEGGSMSALPSKLLGRFSDEPFTKLTPGELAPMNVVCKHFNENHNVGCTRLVSGVNVVDKAADGQKDLYSHLMCLVYDGNEEVLGDYSAPFWNLFEKNINYESHPSAVRSVMGAPEFCTVIELSYRYGRLDHQIFDTAGNETVMWVPSVTCYGSLSIEIGTKSEHKSVPILFPEGRPHDHPVYYLLRCEGNLACTNDIYLLSHR